MGRATLQVADYEKNMKTYASTADRLHIDSFGWDAVKTADGKLTAVRGKNATRKIVWMKNKSPTLGKRG